MTDMSKVLICAVRQSQYPDLMAKHENAIEHTCNVTVGQQWFSTDGFRPMSFYLEVLADHSRQ